MKSTKNVIEEKIIDESSTELIENSTQTTNDKKEKIRLIIMKLKYSLKFQDNKEYLKERLEKVVILVQ